MAAAMQEPMHHWSDWSSGKCKATVAPCAQVSTDGFKESCEILGKSASNADAEVAGVIVKHDSE